MQLSKDQETQAKILKNMSTRLLELQLKSIKNEKWYLDLIKEELESRKKK